MRADRQLPLLTFLATAALTLGAAGIVDWQARVRERALFERAENELVAAIQDRLDHYVDGLRAGVGLFDASHAVDADEFHRFARSLRLHERYPGIQGLGFAKVVSRAPLRTAIVYLEPLDRRNRAALGFDMYSEPTRRAAMSRAVESGQASATGPITLVQEIDPAKQPGFLIYLPVYAKNAAPAGGVGRWAALEGFVYAPFRAGDFFAAIGGGRLDFEVEDPSAAEGRSSLYKHGSPDTAPLRGERQIAVRGRTWTVRMGGRDMMPEFQRWLGWLVGAAGLLVALGFYRIGRLVLRRTEALARAKDELRVITDSLPVLIAYVDQDLRYRFNNKTYESWYGKPTGYFLGRLAGEHLGPEHGAKIRRWMASALRGEDVRYADEVSTGAGVRHVEARFIPDRGAEGINGLFVVVSDVTDQRQTALELERRVAERTTELSAALKELETFSYTVSHDLRSPLRTIQSFSGVLLRRLGPKLDPEDRDYLERVTAAARRMSSLISDLLELSHISRAELRAGPVDLARLAREVEADLRAYWPHQVEFSAPPALEAVGDERLLRIAIENLLSNAWKYTSKTPAPKVTLEVESGAYVVRDNGVGFEPTLALEVFKPFKRLHAREEFEGTGIGLATVERIILRHGGRIWAESAPGKGSAFKFTLGRIS